MWRAHARYLASQLFLGSSLRFFSRAGTAEYRFGPVAAGLFYSLERYDFPAQDGVARVEQLSALTVRASARLLPFSSP